MLYIVSRDPYLEKEKACRNNTVIDSCHYRFKLVFLSHTNNVQGESYGYNTSLPSHRGCHAYIEDTKIGIFVVRMVLYYE